MDTTTSASPQDHPCPAAVLRLVERFGEHVDVYRRGDYNETLLRRDFLDPLFESLGWDVANRASETEACREVVHEDRVKVGGATKAPDYAFRIGGLVPGHWRKVIRQGNIGDVHYFEHVSGQVAGVKFFQGSTL